ncbi:MAG: rod-binding protein [Selenomonadaceae bacterium]|nr:rod-binding protein [Selenomonadaceae bacterium]MBQ4403053.1 rod-binding protein [Selenomonadaceae bacterium]MBQ6131096.1 rod-binding protein [Selenomonadaceae bacterium]
MRIDNSYLLPQMGATGAGAEGAQMLNDEATFQEQLKRATDKLNNSSTKITTMTEAEVAQRNQEIKDASVQLEALLLKMMYNEMWKTVPKNELFGNSNAMDIYRDMYNEELTKKAAEGGGIGLADYIYKQLTKNQSYR